MINGEPKPVVVSGQCGRWRAWRNVVPPTGVCLKRDPSYLEDEATRHYFVENGEAAPKPFVEVKQLGVTCSQDSWDYVEGTCYCWFKATASPPTSSPPPENRAS